jgi:putative peptidoglycan lipid II flippase
VCAGWFTVLAADLTLVSVLPGAEAVIALGLGNVLGMSVAGAALLVAVRRGIGGEALAGVGRAGLVAALAAALAAPVGMVFAGLFGSTGPFRAMIIGAGTALLTVAVFVVTAMVAAKRLLPDTDCGKWLRAPIEYRNRRGRRSAQ